MFGPIEIEEWIWRTPKVSYLRVLAPRLGVRVRGCSQRLELALADFGCEHSIAKANERLAEHYGVRLNPTAIREITLRHARRVQAQLEAEYAEGFRTLPVSGAKQVVAEADGTMICTVAPGSRNAPRPRLRKEARLVVARAQGQITATYGATFGDVAEVGRRWGHCAKAAGWGLRSQIHVVADGAEWIALQSREVFGEQGHFLLDFYHASAYLAEAAERCQPRAPTHWRHTQQGTNGNIGDTQTGHMGDTWWLALVSFSTASCFPFLAGGGRRPEPAKNGIADQAQVDVREALQQF